MTEPRSRTSWLVRVLLGLVLILGLLGMHEISIACAPEAPMSAVAGTAVDVQHDAGVPLPSSDGDMTSHLCLAVLDAGLVLLGLLLLAGLAVPRSPGAPYRGPAPCTRYRPPRHGGRALLNLVCVQRT